MTQAAQDPADACTLSWLASTALNLTVVTGAFARRRRSGSCRAPRGDHRGDPGNPRTLAVASTSVELSLRVDSQVIVET